MPRVRVGPSPVEPSSRSSSSTTSRSRMRTPTRTVTPQSATVRRRNCIPSAPPTRTSRRQQRGTSLQPRLRPMPHRDRVLMGPGPCNPYPEVVEAFTRPLLGHLDPDFLVVLDETCDRLRTVFRTANELTLPISGTGSAGMEAAFVNVVGPGDVVVVGVNGVFGERMCDVASRCGAEVVRVDADWGTALDPQQLLDAHPAPKVIAVVHAETSTGVRNDVEPLGAGKGDALLL